VSFELSHLIKSLRPIIEDDFVKNCLYVASCKLYWPNYSQFEPNDSINADI